jgi:hypothetical protein
MIFLHTRIRDTYYQHIKTLKNITITNFIDKAIGNYLDVINRSDEWIIQEINVKQKEIDSLKSLLTDKKHEREKLNLIEEKQRKYWNNFEIYLQDKKRFNTSFINEECNTNLPRGSLKDFRVLQRRYKNGSFGFEDFKKEVLL